MRFSELPLYQNSAEQTPAPGVYAYEPAFPLFSNGSDKQRLVAGPDGKRPEPDAVSYTHLTLPTKIV